MHLFSVSYHYASIFTEKYQKEKKMMQYYQSVGFDIGTMQNNPEYHKPLCIFEHLPRGVYTLC